MSDKLVRIKNRYDTAENWGTENPILAAGEIGIDSTNNIIKVGNGSSKWNNLSLFTNRQFILNTPNDSSDQYGTNANRDIYWWIPNISYSMGTDITYIWEFMSILIDVYLYLYHV